MEVKMCAYCNEEKPVLPNEYNEPVCRDCSVDLVEQRYDDAEGRNKTKPFEMEWF